MNRTLRSEVRERELSAELSPLRSAYQERTRAITGRNMAASCLEQATRTLHRVAKVAYHDPAEAAERFLAHLQRGALRTYCRPSSGG